MAEDSQTPSAYAGRWVARLRGRIIAQGGTPEQALEAAKQNKYIERPEIIYIPFPASPSPLVDRVRAILPNQEIYLVGGAVRDMMLHRLSHDLDFALPSRAIASARRVANMLKADFMVLDEERDTGRVILAEAGGARTFLDFATYRGASLDEDLRARDFTINAIAYDLRANILLDPLNGASDLRAQIIRACSQTAFTEDPVRILRAVRQAASLDFKIELGTHTSMKQAAYLLPKISPERKRDELFKILESPKPDASIRALERLGVFPHLMPELSAMRGVEQSSPHVHDVWEHTLSVLGYLDGILAALMTAPSSQPSNDPFHELLSSHLGKYQEHLASHFAKSLNADRSVRAALFFAALYHDVEKPATRSVEESGRIRFLDHDRKGAEVASRRGQSFNLSNDEIEYVKKIVKHHMRFDFFTSQMETTNQEPPRKAIYRLFRDAGDAGVDLVLLGLADLRGTRGNTLSHEAWRAALQVAEVLLRNYWEIPQKTVNPPRLLDGNELMRELKLAPGRIVGQLLEEIREGQAIGTIETREQAIAFAREQLEKLEHS